MNQAYSNMHGNGPVVSTTESGQDETWSGSRWPTDNTHLRSRFNSLSGALSWMTQTSITSWSVNCAPASGGKLKSFRELVGLASNSLTCRAAAWRYAIC